jgi:hypothetical protein
MQRPSYRTLASDGKAFDRTAVHKGKHASADGAEAPARFALLLWCSVGVTCGRVAPMLVAFGVRSGEGLPGVLSEVFPASEPEVSGEFPPLDELFISPSLQASIHSF